MTRTEALALRPGDTVLVAGRVRYTVVARPVQRGTHPLMIPARRSDDDRALARNLQLGAIRMEVAE